MLPLAVGLSFDVTPSFCWIRLRLIPTSHGISEPRWDRSGSAPRRNSKVRNLVRRSLPSKGSSNAKQSNRGLSWPGGSRTAALTRAENLNRFGSRELGRGQHLRPLRERRSLRQRNV